MPTDPALAARLERVRGEIAEAVAASGRSPDEVTTVVVTKFHSASLVRGLYELGVRDFGESRHQEAREKAAELSELDLTWHYIGQLQSKKARQATAYSTVIHSVDRDQLADLLSTSERIGGGGVIDCFVQVDLSGEPGRGGVDPGAVEALADHVSELPGLRLRGLMTVAPLGQPARTAFERLRMLSDTVRRSHPDATALSAGMSNDFADAIAEGATHLRIGSAITGNRPQPG